MAGMTKRAIVARVKNSPCVLCKGCETYHMSHRRFDAIALNLTVGSAVTSMGECASVECTVKGLIQAGWSSPGLTCRIKQSHKTVIRKYHAIGNHTWLQIGSYA